MVEKNCFSSSCGRLNFLSWRRKYNLCWAFFTMDSMRVSHFRSWEMVVPRNLNDSTAVTVLLMGWVSPDHPHSFEHVKLQVVKTAPDSQLLNLLTVNKLLDEADQCGVVWKLQEFDRGVFRCAVVGVEGEEQWGENTALRSSSADRMSVCQEVVDPLTDGGGDGELCQFILKSVWDDGVKIGAEVYKQDSDISPCLSRCCRMNTQTCLLSRQTAGCPVRVQWRLSDKPKPVFQMISWPQTLEPQVCGH